VFAIIIGVFVGSYSSVFIAGPMLILFKLRPEMFEKEEGTKKGAGSAPAPASGA
jgi:SecD/SecF fusion protein